MPCSKLEKYFLCVAYSSSFFAFHLLVLQFTDSINVANNIFWQMLTHHCCYHYRSYWKSFLSIIEREVSISNLVHLFYCQHVGPVLGTEANRQAASRPY